MPALICSIVYKDPEKTAKKAAIDLLKVSARLAATKTEQGNKSLYGTYKAMQGLIKV